MSTTVETPLGAVQGRVSEVGQSPFALAIFVSAFLLFQVQLLLGKEVLPLFGGASAVWTVCVFVFQLLFLAGYGYSHGLATLLPLRKQVIVHGALLAVWAIFIAVLVYIRFASIVFCANWHLRAWVVPPCALTVFLFGAGSL